VIDKIQTLPPIVVFRLRNMTAIDATGLRALEDVAERLRASGRTALFCGARDQPGAVMRQAGFIEHVGAENVCPNVEAALARAAAAYRDRHDAGTHTDIRPELPTSHSFWGNE
jgi:SulP family sulfate permease